MATDKQMDVEKLIEEVRLMDCSSLIVPAIRQLAKELKEARRTLSLCNDVCEKWLHCDDDKLGAFEGFKEIHDLACNLKEATDGN